MKSIISFEEDISDLKRTIESFLNVERKMVKRSVRDTEDNCLVFINNTKESLKTIN